SAADAPHASTSEPTADAPTTTVNNGAGTSEPTSPPTDAESTDGGEPDNNSDPNWARIAQRLDDKLVEFYANPEEGLERLDEVCAPGSPCKDTYTPQPQDAVNRGQRAEGWDRHTVTRAELQSFEGDTLAESATATVDIDYEHDGPPYGQIVDDNGEVVQEI